MRTSEGYASNDRHAKTTSSPGSHVIWMREARTPTEPVPKLTSSALTPTRCARACVNSDDAMSG